MKSQLKQTLIKEAQISLVNNPRDNAHDITHHYRTWLNAKEIMKNLKEPFDADLVEIFCWWYDVQHKESTENNTRLAKTTSIYLAEKFELAYKENVLDSIENHEFGSKPKFIKGKILQDADKLEILSEERFRISIDSIKAGLMDKNSFYNAVQTVFSSWLPKMPELYNFEISKKLHYERLKLFEPRLQEYLRILEKL